MTMERKIPTPRVVLAALTQAVAKHGPIEFSYDEYNRLLDENKGLVFEHEIHVDGPEVTDCRNVVSMGSMTDEERMSAQGPAVMIVTLDDLVGGTEEPVDPDMPIQ